MGGSRVRDGFLRRWIVLVTIGETAGFAVPAVAGSLTAGADLATAPAYAVVVAAGVAEGALLGLAQARAFAPRVPVSAVRWCALSATGAAIAWSLGMLMPVVHAQRWSSQLTGMAMIALGAALLLSMPALQCLELRRHVPRARRWIGINAVAWSAGIAWTFLPSPFIDEHTAVGPLISAYVTAGLMMALTVATVTGIGATRLEAGAGDGPR